MCRVLTLHIHGMRNPKNSWDKSDSYDAVDCGKCGLIEEKGVCNKEDRLGRCDNFRCYAVGDNDLKLMKTLFNAGTEHRKYDRMIQVWMDIEAPCIGGKNLTHTRLELLQIVVLPCIRFTAGI